ncbi:hypothetical protein [Coleofasciculus sp.]
MLTINQGLQRLGYGGAIARSAPAKLIAPFCFILCNSVIAQILPDLT